MLCSSKERVSKKNLRLFRKIHQSEVSAGRFFTSSWPIVSIGKRVSLKPSYSSFFQREDFRKRPWSRKQSSKSVISRSRCKVSPTTEKSSIQRTRESSVNFGLCFPPLHEPLSWASIRLAPRVLQESTDRSEMGPSPDVFVCQSNGTHIDLLFRAHRQSEPQIVLPLTVEPCALKGWHPDAVGQESHAIKQVSLKQQATFLKLGIQHTATTQCCSREGASN